MSNSRSYTKITRLILFAGALLAILMFASPQRHLAHAQTLPSETIDYAEGGTAPVAAYTAVDPEGESIVWTLTGTDAGDFTIDGGVLKFNSTPDYEIPPNGNNTYTVTVTASDGSSDSEDSTQEVTVNIVNLEEPGTVSLSTRQPQVGNLLTATLSDPDNVTDDSTTWKWERSQNGRTGWTEIEVVTDSNDQNPNPNANVYTPVEDDEGYFLRATASYDDGQGDDKSAEMVSYFAVQPVPYSNKTPVFLDAEGEEIPDKEAVERSVAENSEAGVPVGEPVQATDAAETGPDVLTYKLDNTDTFSIDSATGQIEVGAGTTLDYDTEPIRYDVEITATDPSGLEDTIDVTINITNVDETPVVKVLNGGTVRTHNENEPATSQVAIFSAEDPEDEDNELMWSLSGADGDKFDINDAGAQGVFTFKASPDFEAPGDANRNNVYEVTVQSTDSGANTGSLDVTVTVGNVNEDGVVTLSNRQPEDNIPIIATLKDPDGGITDLEWKWQAAGIDIDGATSATFKPTGTQVGQTLKAKASYTDGHGANKMAEEDSANAVQATDTSNAAPVFQDKDGDAITSLDRSVEENKLADDPVGERVEATDEKPDGQGGTAVDDANLTYSLEGRDAGSFDIDRATGQIKVGKGASLDYETKTRYTVTVRVKDPSNLTDTVTVNITVTNMEEDPEITAGPMTVEYAENRADAVATYTATDPEDDSASPRKPLTWTLTGSDAADFTIDGGMLKFKTPPDFENDQGLGNGNNVYDVVVMVTDSATGTTSATRSVMVTVTNVEEAGTVTLSAEQPQEEVALTATLSDPDVVTADSAKWQWARSRNGSSGWTDIEVDTKTNNPNANIYTPVNDDVGYYLRATVTYKDGESAADVQENDKTAQAVSTNPVRKTPYENAAPVFQDAEGEKIPDDEGVVRSVAENSRAGTAVGDPVAATDQGDSRPDVLTYTLDTAGAALFDIDSGTGQIKVKAGENLNHESMETYTVTVTATDPSHVPNDDQNNFSDSITVTIMVTDVDEFPAFTEGDTEVDYEEKGTDAVDTYPATDPEDDIASPQKPRKWSLSGIDGSKFAISDAGALTFVTPPDYEAPADSGRNNVYNVTVEATDSSGNTSARVVTVTVDNIEEAGTVTLSNLQPEDGVYISASLTDPDGRISGLTWQWATTSGQSPDPVGDDDIDGATSATYKPVSGNVREWLWAIATYTDGYGQDTAMKVSGYAVQAADTTNEPPKFADQDPDTEGDQTDLTRTVAEDTTSTSVSPNVEGGAVTAMDEDDENLTYTLGGDDKNSFAIDRKTGQISVGKGTTLNFESKDTYVVMVTATDATGDSATVKVTITVTGVDEPPELSKKALVVIGDERVDYLENGTDTVETYTAAGPDSVGARWSLSGTDASRFALSNGVLSFRSSPNFESPTDSDSDNVYNVIVQASKGTLQDARTVTIKVINLDEKGAIRLSSQQPDVGIELGATLTDPDGGVTGERWQWARSPDGATRWSDIPAASSATYTPVLADAANFLRVTVGYEDAQGGGKSASAETSGATGVDNDGVVTLSSSTPQVGVELTASLRDPDGGVTGEAWQWARSQDGASNWQDIATATSNAYTPVTEDADNYLRATVSYTDGDGPGKSANEISANAVAVVAVIENTPPEFPATETGARSVPEGTAAGTNIGAPVAAEDTPGDTLTYTLGGTDAASFDIVAATGQLQTKVALDAATKSTYTVTVTATDTDGLSDTFTVTITVTSTVTCSTLGELGDRYDANNDCRIDRDEVIAAIRDYFDDLISRDDVIAIIRLYFTT